MAKQKDIKKGTEESTELTENTAEVQVPSKVVTFRNATGRRVTFDWAGQPHTIPANGLMEVPSESSAAFYNHVKAFGAWARL